MTISAQASPTTSRYGSHARAGRRTDLRARGEQVGAVEDQRDLRELRRAGTGSRPRRSSAAPRSPRPRRPGRRPRRAGRTRRRAAAGVSGRAIAHAADRGTRITTRPIAPKISGALQVVGAVAASPSSEVVELALKTITTPEGEQAERRGEQQRVLDRRRAAASLAPFARAAAVIALTQRLHQLAEVLAALPRSRGRRRSSRRPARAARPRPARRGRRRPRTARSEVAAACSSTPAVGAARGRRASCSARLADQVARRRSARRPARASASKRSPLSEPPRITWTPPSKESIAASAAATLVAFESLT